MVACCDIIPGQLIVPIEIQEEQSVPDGAGGHIKAWVTVWSGRTKWRHASMYERLQAMQLQAGVMHRVYARYSPIPKPNMRVWYKGQPYQIRGVVDIEERHRWLELSVEEGVAV